MRSAFRQLVLLLLCSMVWDGRLPASLVAADCVLSPPGLINFWPATGHFKDPIGYLNGSPQNGVTFRLPQQEAFLFDGVDDQIDLNASPIPPPWTAEFWVYRQPALTTSAVLLADDTSALKLEQHPGTGKVGFTVWGVADYAFEYSAPVGEWIHLVFRSTESTMLLYVNGNLQDTLPQTTSLPRGQMGNYVYGQNPNAFHGYLDEVALYNRGLGSLEIEQLYRAGANGKCASGIPPPNDHFANRISVGDLDTELTTIHGSNTWATLEPGETNRLGPGYGGKSVWYSYIPSQSGLWRVFLRDPEIYRQDTWYVMAAGMATSAQESIVLTPAVLPPPDSLINYLSHYRDVVAGQEYAIAIDGSSVYGEGAFTLMMDHTPAPDNDMMAAATPIVGRDYSADIDFLAATIEPSEPDHRGGHASLWWTWIAPENGLATMRATQVGNFVPRLGVYHPNDYSALEPKYVSEQVIGHTRQMTFRAFKGRSYALAISGEKYHSIDRTTVKDVHGQGRFDFQFSTLAILVESVQSALDPDTLRTSFQADIRVGNLGTALAGPLQLRLIARQGVSMTKVQAAHHPDLPEEERKLGVFQLPSGGFLSAGGSDLIMVSGKCPEPTPEYIVYQEDRGVGWEVFCLLEERFGSHWFVQDKRLLLQGAWPQVGGFEGPGGGVIRLDAFAPNPFSYLSEIEILGPAAVYEGRETPFAALATVISQFSTQQVMFSQTDWRASHFSIATNGLFQPGTVSADTEVELTAPANFSGHVYEGNRAIRVIDLPPPKLSIPKPKGPPWIIEIKGVLGRDHVLESSPALHPQASWIPVATQTIATPLPGPIGLWEYVDPGHPSRFFRVREN